MTRYEKLIKDAMEKALNEDQIITRDQLEKTIGTRDDDYLVGEMRRLGIESIIIRANEEE
ncbi:MAG: hypothetical protein ACI4P9_04475 [Selenomonadaceae bacterium]